MKKNLIILLLCMLGISANAKTYDVLVPSFSYSGDDAAYIFDLEIEGVALKEGDVVNFTFNGTFSIVLSGLTVTLFDSNFNLLTEWNYHTISFGTTEVNTSVSVDIISSSSEKKYVIKMYPDHDNDFTFSSCLDIPIMYNGIEYKRKSKTEVYVSGQDSSVHHGNIVIPSTITSSDGISCQVSSIGKGAFLGCTSLTSVTIPENLDVSNAGLSFEKDGIRYNVLNGKEVEVTYKFDDAGYNLYSGDIVIPSTVTAGNTFSVIAIDRDAFFNCTDFTSVTIPSSVTNGYVDAYSKTAVVEVINYSSSVNVEAEYVYNGGKTIIGDFAFSENDKKLVRYLGDGGELVLPENFKGHEYTFNTYAFRGQNFTSISIPKNVNVSSCDLYLVKDGIRYHVLNGNEIAVIRNYDSEYNGDVVIPSTVTAGNTFTVTAINSYSFSNNSGLTSITIPSSVASIGYGAFSGCTSLTEVTCYAVQPPEINGSFENYNAYLYVPCESRKLYDLHSEWGSFKYIECIGSEEVDLQKDEVVVEPEQTAAVFSMPTNESANSYTLTIQNNGVTFCTLTFNAQGQLSNIDFSTTKSYELKAGVSAYQFTVTGLSEATDYGYSFKALSSSKSVLKEYTGSFTTQNADGTGGSSQGGAEVEGGSGQGGEGGEQGGSTAINGVSNATTVTIENNQILVNGEAPAFVVTVSGKKIVNLNLKSGVYFVNVEGKTVKVSVK